MQPGGIEWQQMVFVLQENDAFFSDVLGGRHSALDIRHLPDDRMIKQTAGKNRAQDALDVIVQLLLGDFSALDRFLQSVAIEILARLLLVQAGVRRLGGGVGSAPVRNYESFEVEAFLQKVGKQIAVLAGIIAVDPVVRTHHSTGVGNSQRDLKGEKIGFAHGALVDVGVDGVASALLIVDGVVLEVADQILGLHALHEVADQSSRQQRIFALVLKGAAVARFAGEIDAAAERHAVSLIAQFPADQGPVLEGGLRIPGRRRGKIVRQGG